GHQARHPGEGKQAETRPVRGARRHEEARRSRDGHLRQGNRRRGHLRKDQYRLRLRRPSTTSRGKPCCLPHQRPLPPGAPMTEIPMPPNPTLWRRATAAYAKLLEFLLAICLGILVIPVTLQIISRYTPFIPSY